jgi:hypothetical protein
MNWFSKEITRIFREGQDQQEDYDQESVLTLAFRFQKLQGIKSRPA